MSITEAAKRVKIYYIQNRRMPSIQELGEILGLASKKTVSIGRKN